MRPALCAILCAVLHAAPAAAQPVQTLPATSPKDVLFAQGNLLGLLEYCQTQGFIGMAPIERQREVMRQYVQANAIAGQLPGIHEAAGREAGKQGIVAFWESRVPIAVAAGAQGITVEWRCKYTELSLALP